MFLFCNLCWVRPWFKASNDMSEYMEECCGSCVNHLEGRLCNSCLLLRSSAIHCSRFDLRFSCLHRSLINAAIESETNLGFERQHRAPLGKWQWFLIYVECSLSMVHKTSLSKRRSNHDAVLDSSKCCCQLILTSTMSPMIQLQDSASWYPRCINVVSLSHISMR